MANISEYLAQILSARYGRDVRGSIHDAIDIINQVGEKVLSVGTAITDPTSSSTGYFTESLYLNSDTMELWKCVGTNAWQSQGILKGKDGEDGEAGADGKGIASIAKTSTSGLVDTYTITYTDGTSQTYNVENGADGENGNKWYRGTGITGTNTNPTKFTDSGVTYAYANDNYLNTSTGAVYHCTTEGNPNNALWVYDFTMSGGGSSITVIDNLTSQSSSDALAANQGRVLNGLIGEKANTSDMTTALAGKVDKVTGKVLSTNDYTNADKAKVALIDGLQSDVEDLQESKADADDVYLKTETYSDDEVDDLLNEKADSDELDTWTAEQTVTTSGSDNVVTFTGLNDSLAYDIYCDAINTHAEVKTKSGSGTAVTVVYKISGDNVVVGTTKCKLRILK